MPINKPQVDQTISYFLIDFQDCWQQGCCRQGHSDVFTPYLENQSGCNLW